MNYRPIFKRYPRVFTFSVIIAVGLAAGLAGMFVLGAVSRRASKPVFEGRLADVPESPNCVSTRATDSLHSIAPLTFEGSPAEAMDRLGRIISEMPRTTICSVTARYMHVEFTTAFFGFVDDVEFLIDPDHQRIDFRSASRVGHSDLGANRRRMEDIRRRFDMAVTPGAPHGNVTAKENNMDPAINVRQPE